MRYIVSLCGLVVFGVGLGGGGGTYNIGVLCS